MCTTSNLFPFFFLNFNFVSENSATRKQTGQFSHIRSIALFSLALLMLWLLKLLSKSVQSTAYHASTSFKISRLLQTGWECSQNALIDIEELFFAKNSKFLKHCNTITATLISLSVKTWYLWHSLVLFIAIKGEQC